MYGLFVGISTCLITRKGDLAFMFEYVRHKVHVMYTQAQGALVNVNRNMTVKSIQCKYVLKFINNSCV